MEHVTRIALSNTNNPNRTEVYTLSTPEDVSSILMENGWIEEGEGQFSKDRVIVTVEEKILVVDVDRALNQLFF